MKAATIHENNASTIEWKTYGLGTTLKQGGSDFTASGTTQTFVLDSIEPGDIVISHLVRVDVVKALGHAANWSVEVGVNGDSNRFIATTELKALSLVGDTAVPSSATLADLHPYVRINANAIDLTAVVTVGSGNVSDTTAGEVWITVPIIRRKDRVTRRGAI